MESIWCSNKQVEDKSGGKEDSCVDPKDFEATDDTKVSGYPNEVGLDDDDDDGVAEETKVIPTISYYVKLPLRCESYYSPHLYEKYLISKDCGLGGRGGN